MNAETEVTRRSFLRGTLGAAGGLTAVAAALSPLRDLDTSELTLDDFLQSHYKEMTPDELAAVLKRIAAEVERRYDVRPDLRDVVPMDGVEFAYALDLGRCIGCRKCVHACVAENNQSRSPEIQYIRVLEMPRGTVDVEKGNHHYDRPTVPDDNHFYMPVQCHQCANPPCVKVCPVEATWQEADGITVIDYDWCIGCRYCEAACPYWARRFNFTEPQLPKADVNPKMAYLSNRPRSKGVMEKCHFCLHRTREGQACRPASRSARSARASSATSSIPRARCRRSCAQARLRAQAGGRHAAAVLLLLRRGLPARQVRQVGGTEMKEYVRFLWRCARISFVGDWRYYLWMLALTVIALARSERLLQAVGPWAGHHRHDRPGLLGPVHRQLHLPGRDGRCGGDAGDPGLHVPASTSCTTW